MNVTKNSNGVSVTFQSKHRGHDLDLMGSMTMKDVMENEAKEHLNGLNKIKDKRTFEEKRGPCTKIAQAIVEELQKPTIDERAAPWAGPALQNIFTKLKGMPVPEEKLLEAAPKKN
ncbi:hypothetical protein MRX96_015836 [Rhipicephalus microplus]